MFWLSFGFSYTDFLFFSFALHSSLWPLNGEQKECLLEGGGEGGLLPAGIWQPEEADVVGGLDSSAFTCVKYHKNLGFLVDFLLN